MNIVKVAEAEKKKKDSNGSKEIRELTSKYRELTLAQREWVKAYKSGDTDQQKNGQIDLYKYKNPSYDRNRRSD